MTIAAKLLELVRGGMNVREASRITGAKYQVALRLVKSAGIRPTNQKVPDDQLLRADWTKTDPDLAKELGISAQTVSTWREFLCAPPSPYMRMDSIRKCRR